MLDKYWDNETKTISPFGENEILFTTEYYIMAYRLGLPITLRELILMPRKMLNKDYNGFSSRDPSQTWSHDNHTALVCLSHAFSLGYHKRIFWKDWVYRIHPRDIIFYIWASGGIVGFLFNLLLPISLFLSLFEVFVTQYKNIDGRQVLATDGKLLTWLRINSFHLPITKFLADYWIKKKFGGWDAIFAVYFPDIDHPIRQLILTQGVPE